MKSIVIAGTHSGVGKTTITLGILSALKKRGIRTQPFKVGPDYIDTAYHSFIAGRKSRNLDGWMLDEETIKYLFVKNSQDVDISVIEGVMGMFDGLDSRSFTGSTAHIAKTIRSPLILVVDGSGIGASVAAAVLGYKKFDEDVNLAGVIFNNLGGEGHYQLLKDAVENSLGVKVLGYLPRKLDFQLPERHLGLLPIYELDSVKRNFSKLCELIEKHIDLDAVLGIADIPEIETRRVPLSIKPLGSAKIAVAMDKAFNFYYWDNLDLLKELGAELEYFSPLEDKALPDDVSGIYIGGGFPEVFASELESNEKIRGEIKKACQLGLPVYAECGGLMYLMEEILDIKGRPYRGVGLFKGRTRMTDSLQRFGYINLEFLQNTPIGRKGEQTRAHEFHHSVLDVDEEISYGYVARKAGRRDEGKSWPGGLVKHNTLAGYAHIHFYSNPQIAVNFIKSCLDYKTKMRRLR